MQCVFLEFGFPEADCAAASFPALCFAGFVFSASDRAAEKNTEILFKVCPASVSNGEISLSR